MQAIVHILIIKEIHYQLQNILACNGLIIMWIQAHPNILENETAGSLAKQWLTKEHITNITHDKHFTTKT